MSVQKVNRYNFRRGEWWTVAQPWYINLLAFALVAGWMAWTFATIQQFGPDPALVGSALVIAVVALLVIYGQRLRYLRFGSWFELELRTHNESEETEREKYR